MTRKQDTTGLRPTSRHFTGRLPDNVWGVLKHVADHPLAIDTDYSRSNRVHVNLAASLGWISTVTPDGKGYGRRWFITIEGLSALRWKDKFTS